MADEDWEEATPEEKLRIAQHYMLSSPPGQINDVLGDTKKLLPGGLLSESQISDIFRAYNLDTLKIVEMADHRTLIGAAAEVDGSHYVDPHSGEVFGFNHITQKIIEGDSRPIAGELDASMEEPRKAIQDGVVAYIKRQFGAKNVACGAFAKAGCITVLISAEKLSLRNFWSGNWRSQFEIRFTGGTVATVTGWSKIHIHYFEDGNVQMQNSKECNHQVNFTDAADLGKNVTAAIEDHENTIQHALEEMYSNMSGDTFKEMRRVMPVTHTKFDWNVNAHKMVRNLRK
jgi:capping protein alpha